MKRSHISNSFKITRSAFPRKGIARVGKVGVLWKTMSPKHYNIFFEDYLAWQKTSH